eukprot:TRINITY_DN20196_c0_g1::TRINITY_DN20196_c0_g1_i1::g.30363::m.30363 TRINITY_DN20196_c0_g1::TRINITY_DN20196_c0_g1_i1::g.30363  ORF type:complete len:215 (-),score=-1.24,IQ/PF00612.22/0.63,IQ/PF00612.22/14,IQ/PF00612.22/3.2e+03,IQ/PF00612.22/6e+03 TRINITY_DN20196_c0_g1_i1:57-647(-)
MWALARLQGFCRMVIARRRVRWKRSVALLKMRKRSQAMWQARQAWIKGATRHQRHFAEVSSHVARETGRANREIQLEVKRMERSFREWNKMMTSSILHKPLSQDWVMRHGEQHEQVYVNLVNGQVHHEHPHLRLVESNRKREKARADKILEQRLQLLQQYREHLKHQESTLLEAVQANILQILAAVYSKERAKKRK